MLQVESLQQLCQASNANSGYNGTSSQRVTEEVQTGRLTAEMWSMVEIAKQKMDGTQEEPRSSWHQTQTTFGSSSILDSTKRIRVTHPSASPLSEAVLPASQSREGPVFPGTGTPGFEVPAANLNWPSFTPKLVLNPHYPRQEPQIYPSFVAVADLTKPVETLQG